MKNFILAGIIVFFVFAFLAFAVSIKFDFSQVVNHPYTTVNTYFAQWSTALGAAGSIIIAVLAYTAIDQGHRNQQSTLRSEYLSRTEAFVANLSMFSNEFRSLLLQSVIESRDEKLYASYLNSVSNTRVELMRGMVFTGHAVISLNDKDLIAQYSEVTGLLTGLPFGTSPDDRIRIVDTVKQLGIISENMVKRVQALKEQRF
jgi:hypothetical protein